VLFLENDGIGFDSRRLHSTRSVTRWRAKRVEGLLTSSAIDDERIISSPSLLTDGTHVLDRNLLEIPVDDIGETQVLKTIFKGKVVYQCVAERRSSPNRTWAQGNADYFTTSVSG
jgi:hypothetical protein